MVYITFRLVSKPRKIELDEVKLKDEIKIDKSKTLAVMLQNDTGEYTESESNAFPTTGYRFNSTKSGCTDVNGNIIENALTYNNETNKVNLKINREVKCYTYFDKLYTVTYELNGGEFDVTPPVKEVAYGDTYGELPEPTKEGYTFKGWNGKNMLNLSNVRFENCILNHDNSIISNINNTYYSYIVLTYLNDYLLSSLEKTFTFSMNETISGKNMSIVVYGSRINGTKFQETNSNNRNFVSITVADDFTNITSVDLSFNRNGVPYSDAITTRKNFQLEEGSVATEYEPFYIRSDTKVVQRQNHTLKAIWEENV